MIAWAFTPPMSGSMSSCSFVAVLMLIFWPGASFGAAVLAAGAAGAAADAAGAAGAAAAGAADLAGTAGAAAAAGAAGAAAAGAPPTVTLSLRELNLTPSPIPLTFFRSSTLLKGRAAMIALAVAAPTPGRASRVFASAPFRSTRPEGAAFAALAVFASALGA